MIMGLALAAGRSEFFQPGLVVRIQRIQIHFVSVFKLQLGFEPRGSLDVD